MELTRTKATNCFYKEIAPRFNQCVAQDEAFMYEFDFTKLAPIVVFELFMAESQKNNSNEDYTIPSLVNDSSLITQLAAYVRELGEEEKETFTIDGPILKFYF